MVQSAHLQRANWLALIIPAALLAGAYIGQWGFALFPCEMCWWQRYPHFVAVGFALIGFFVPPRQLWIGLAALAVLVSGLIGGFHAGVEYGWWEGLTACANAASAGNGDPLAAILDTPLISCNEVQWSLLGISLAGWNCLISCAGAAVIFLQLRGAGQKGLTS